MNKEILLKILNAKRKFLQEIQDRLEESGNIEGAKAYANESLGINYAITLLENEKFQKEEYEFYYNSEER